SIRAISTAPSSPTASTKKATSESLHTGNPFLAQKAQPGMARQQIAVGRNFQRSGIANDPVALRQANSGGMYDDAAGNEKYHQALRQREGGGRYFAAS
ncbi:MAG: hypothetical protein E7B29_16555, partial [Mixta calida]|nr:hypothetical protein [Mixta calida]